MNLRRLIVEFMPDGLERALHAPKEGPVESVGESGFSVREDVLSLETPCQEGNPMRADKPCQRGEAMPARGSHANDRDLPFLPKRSNKAKQQGGA